MDFVQSLGYLDALAALGIKAGLGHTRHLAGKLGDPQCAYPCILIAGTNGKGSTSSFLASILRASGFRVGLYTSPHLVDIRERVQVEGEIITHEAFSAVLTRVREVAESAIDSGELGGPPTYFEALTLIAFEHFKRAAVEVAVLEVGLGGRLDCTNIADPCLCVVTNISLDHEDHLGPGLENIAREKAGIFRPGVPALTGEGIGEALETLLSCAKAAGTPLVAGPFSKEFSALPPLTLLGEHQRQNAALALASARSLRQSGWALDEDAMADGLRSARWPGRIELAGRSPDFYLDGAHNPAGCAALARFLSGLPQGRRALVFAVMGDKPIAAMLAPLRPEVQALWATRVPMPRCAQPESILHASSGFQAKVQEDPLTAVEEARAWAGKDGLVVAAGSLYLVGYLKSLQGGSLSQSWGSGL